MTNRTRKPTWKLSYTTLHYSRMLSGVSFIGAEMSPSLPPRTHSLTYIAKEPLDPIEESAQDLERARHLLSNYNLHDEGTKSEELKGLSQEVLESYARMIDWVEKLVVLLQNEHNDQIESKTALVLAESNLQMALANNEMLEDALRQAGPNVKDVGWRRLSKRERLRQDVKENEELENTSEEESCSPVHKLYSTPPPQTQLMPSHHQPSSSLRFFNFPSLSRSALPLNGHSSSSLINSESPAGAQLPHPHLHSRPSSPASSRPTAREKELSILLDKEKEALKSVTAAKLALENELETLSQALFEEANKMVSTSNRKLAEIEEELRVVMEEREALRSALRIVENENGTLRAKNLTLEDVDNDELQEHLLDENERFHGAAESANYLHLVKSTPLADPASFIAISPVDSDVHASPSSPDIQTHSNTDEPSQCSEVLTDIAHFPQAMPIRSVRWSVVPRTPHSRIAVKNAFERAMLRMERLIEDVEGNS